LVLRSQVKTPKSQIRNEVIKMILATAPTLQFSIAVNFRVTPNDELKRGVVTTYS
jgi:hypothetical protein